MRLKLQPHRVIWSLFLGITPVAAEKPENPNIVFIMADDLGYGHLGCYGQTKIRTPHIDRLAAQGVRFTDVYAGAPVCAPSRSVLMTGLHGGHTPVRGNSGGIPLHPGDITIAELLKEAGYSTGLFGKWGLGEFGTDGVPWKQGFDEFFGYLHQYHAHFYYPEYLWHNDRRYPLPGNLDGQRGQYTHDEIVAKAMGFIRDHQEEPFFLYLPFAVPHYELLVPEGSLKEYAGKFPETPYEGRGRPTGYPSDYAKQPMPKAATAAIISHMDRSVGKIMDLLGELNLDEETIVIFTSDNGPVEGAADPDFFEASGPLRGYKRTLYEGGLRVPAIIRWTGKIQAGTVNRTPWHFADVLPTLTEIAGRTTPENIDGKSMLPLLLGSENPVQVEDRVFYWEFRGAAAIRYGKWKAIRPIQPDAPVELYDLSTDISENNNVADDYPDIIAKLIPILESAHLDPRPQIEPEPPADKRFR